MYLRSENLCIKSTFNSSVSYNLLPNLLSKKRRGRIIKFIFYVNCEFFEKNSRISSFCYNRLVKTIHYFCLYGIFQDTFSRILKIASKSQAIIKMTNCFVLSTINNFTVHWKSMDRSRPTENQILTSPHTYAIVSSLILPSPIHKFILSRYFFHRQQTRAFEHTYTVCWR